MKQCEDAPHCNHVRRPCATRFVAAGALQPAVVHQIERALRQPRALHYLPTKDEERELRPQHAEGL
eukprot:6787472-Prymnesium_polylepis.2